MAYIFSGLFVLIITLVSSIYTILRIRNNCVFDTAILSTILLTIIHQNTQKNIVYSDILARASVSALTTIASYLATLYILKISLNIFQIIYVTCIFIISGILGILFFDSISDKYMDNNKFPFPQQTPRINILKNINGSNDSKKLKISIIISTIISSFLEYLIFFLIM